MIREIISFLREKTEYKYYFGEANIKNVPCIIYSFSDSGNNGILRKARLELNIAVKGLNENSIIEAEKIKNKINSLILTFGDRPLSTRILNVEQNGGGMIRNEGANTTHHILFYDIICKEKR